MSNVLAKDTIVVSWREGEQEPTETASATEATVSVMQQTFTETTSGATPGIPTNAAVRQGTVSHTYTVPETSRSITFACEANTGVFDPWTLILGFTADTRAERIRAKVRQGNFGVPLHVFSDGSYIALWAGQQGIGLYVFVGYSVIDHPTQTIEITADGGVITT